MQTRIEHDSIGDKAVPADVYYGVQTLRCVENFTITGAPLHPVFINSLAEIKKACAIANRDAGELTAEEAGAIVRACDEILSGKLHEFFVVDPIEGGAGTSMNMNANEVIANRAGELLGGELGKYDKIHPNDHVNRGQSTNDVIPTAGKITALRLLKSAVKELKRLRDTFEKKAVEFDGIIKMGRTQLQDAVPVRLGQEFHAYATTIGRDVDRLNAVCGELLSVNLGGTAIGTGINANRRYYDSVVPCLCAVTGFALTQAEDMIGATQMLDGFVAVSGVIKTCAVDMSKIANDLRLMSSGPRCGIGEINLPARQNGSSIMPGKVNPVIPEVVNQVAFNIIGNDVTITMAAEAGQMELNAFEPIVFHNLFRAITQLENATRTFIDHCVAGITANEERCRDLVEGSVGIITSLCPHVGYQKAADLAKLAIRTGEPVRKLIIDSGLMSPEQVDAVLDPFAMTEPGVL